MATVSQKTPREATREYAQAVIDRLRINAALLRAIARGEAPGTMADLAALADDLDAEADCIEVAAARRAEHELRLQRDRAA